MDLGEEVEWPEGVVVVVVPAMVVQLQRQIEQLFLLHLSWSCLGGGGHCFR